MKSTYCLLAVLLLGLCTAAPLRAQCADCGAGDAGHYGPYGINPACRGTCHHYYSEQEWLASDWCQCCVWNWGWQHIEANALTPRFRPAWRLSADALFLMRDGDRDIEFATLGPRTADGRNVVLDSDSLEECFEIGTKTTISRSLSTHDNLLIEGTYLGLHEWNEEDAYRDATPNAVGGLGILTSPFTNFGRPQLVGFDFNTLTTIGYTSDLESGEINLRHRVGLMCGPLETSVLYGIRYVRIDESFSYTSVSAVQTNTVAVSTNNDLFGFQAGILSAYRVSDRWWFEFDLKATLAANNNEQQTLYQAQTPAAIGSFAFEAQSACQAFVGDINLMSNYQVTRYLTVRAGYQAIWVDGVAVALENFSPSIPVLTLGPAEVNDNGTLVFHGPHLGLVLAW